MASRSMCERPWRLLFYTHALAGGGAERVFALIASEMARRGHAVAFAVDREGEANRPYLDRQVDFIRLCGGNVRAVVALMRLMRRERYDMSFSAIGGPNLKHVLAAALAGSLRRAIQTVHGFRFDEPGFLNQAGHRLLPLTARLAASVIVVSDALGRHLIKEVGVDARRIRRVHNPVFTPLSPPSRQAAGAPTVLFVGRLVPAKDPLSAIRAVAALARRDVHLTVLGEGPLRGEMAALAAALGIAERVAFLGYVPEPWPHFARADCLLLTSQRETFGNVVVEALAFGLPVVATSCGGVAEILDRPGLGHLVEVGDHAAMAAALGRALDDPGDPAIRRSRARDFSVAAAADRYEAVVDEVMAAGSASRPS